MEWPDYYEEENVRDLLRFFDQYLRGIENGWRETHRVRYSLLDLTGHDRIQQPAAEFPPEGATEVRYCLNAASTALSTEVPSEEAVANYDSQSEDGCVSFTIRLESVTAFIGYPKVCLGIEADGADDLDLFVFLQKLDADGQQLEQFNIANHGPKIQE